MRQHLKSWLTEGFESSKSLLTRGPDHRDRLDSIDSKIVVSGTRGKSTLTRWVYETLYGREHDVTAKITGNKPVTIHSGKVSPIERDSSVTLYENISEIREHKPSDALVVENQAISPHTTRLVNKEFVDPDVVAITNVREDHLSTLGSSRAAVARAMARSIPEGTHVVNGERDPEIRAFLNRELRRQGATVSNVTVPPEHSHVPGIESVYALNQILAAIGETPLTSGEREGYRTEMTVEWTWLPEGPVYNAAEVNDVQSTEMARQALQRRIDGPIQPFVFLRGDRRGRTVSFVRYLNDLYESEGAEAFGTVHVAGEGSEAFKRRAEFPVTFHDHTTEDAAVVLDELLWSCRPVMLMGNTVSPFMRELADEIDSRKRTERDVVGIDTADSDETAISPTPNQA